MKLAISGKGRTDKTTLAAALDDLPADLLRCFEDILRNLEAQS